MCPFSKHAVTRKYWLDNQDEPQNWWSWHIRTPSIPSTGFIRDMWRVWSILLQSSMLLIVPGEPPLRIFKHLRWMFFKGSQVFERVDTRQITGMYNTHKEISDVSTMLCLIEKSIFSMQDCPFQSLLTQVIIQRGLWYPQEESERFPALFLVRHSNTLLASSGLVIIAIISISLLHFG